MPCRLSKARFAEVVEAALRELPQPFSEIVAQLTIEILDRVTPAHRKKLGLEPGDELLGYYEGVSLLDRGIEQTGTMPGIIYIFQNEHESLAEDETELTEEIRTTVLHEIGHHFGMTEADLDELGYG